MIDFSVVIPCYNSEKTIVKCIQSVFSQTLLPKEIIVIDDGSKDCTLDLLFTLKKETCPKEINFIILSQENSGPSVARNKGIAIAKGNWIAFLDSDDYWKKDKIELQVNFLNNNTHIDLVGCSNLQNESGFKYILFKELLYSNKFQTSSVMIRKKVMEDFLFNEKQKYSEDYRSWLLIAYNYKTALIHPELAFSIENKIAYGGSGLASKLKEMEKGELSNFKILFDLGYINLVTYLKCSCVSLLKYFKRVFVIKIIKR